MSRTFTDVPATRSSVPLLVGLGGASSSGKTFSALRLTTGIQQVVGGDIYGIDTEARRMSHYADYFKFRHVEFKPPFGPLDYLEAIQYCASKGAKTILIDSLSHEHEGQGGVLEIHEQELERMAGSDWAKRERVKMAAWIRPKAERRKLIQGILQLGINLVCCFRAKETAKPVKNPQGGKTEIVDMGFVPIAPMEFVFEMTLMCLLYPGSKGVPTWNSSLLGEQSMMKCPVQFESIFTEQKQLDENIGQQLAEWAKGGPASTAATVDKPTTASTTASAGAGANQGVLDAIQKAINEATKKRPEGVAERDHKVALMEKYFGSPSWKTITGLPEAKLENGLFSLKAGEELL